MLFSMGNYILFIVLYSLFYISIILHIPLYYILFNILYSLFYIPIILRIPLYYIPYIIFLLALPGARCCAQSNVNKCYLCF